MTPSPPGTSGTHIQGVLCCFSTSTAVKGHKTNWLKTKPTKQNPGFSLEASPSSSDYRATLVCPQQAEETT